MLTLMDGGMNQWWGVGYGLLAVIHPLTFRDFEMILTPVARKGGFSKATRYFCDFARKLLIVET